MLADLILFLTPPSVLNCVAPSSLRFCFSALLSPSEAHAKHASCDIIQCQGRVVVVGGMMDRRISLAITKFTRNSSTSASLEQGLYRRVETTAETKACSPDQSFDTAQDIAVRPAKAVVDAPRRISVGIVIEEQTKRAFVAPPVIKAQG
ncbi:MAG: hypothetical protein ABJO67_16530 [Pseudoruegeria sp.]|uniref:hypothetical protein n=1 Tax=Shimia thalassica TaxID=1715693 RepID=UPI003298E5B4